jgi:hypothetical protein
MGQRTITYDDINGQSIATTTIRFSVDDDFLEIDLSDEHADDFTKALAPFVAAARSYSPATSARKPGMSKDERNAITEWAKTVGIDIAPRGRIASDIVARFKAAQEAEGHATVEQIEQAMEAAEKSTETPAEEPEKEPEAVTTSTASGRSRRK